MQFRTVGGDLQAVIVDLGPSESVQAEAGTMLYITDAVQMDTQMRGGIMGGLQRLLTGATMFMTHFRALGAPGQVAFAAPYPGTVREVPVSGEGWLCQRDSFLFSTEGVDITVAFTKRFGAGLFGGEGFILQQLRGQGAAFIHGGGTFLDFELQPGQRLRVDTGCIVAFEPTVTYDIQFVGGFKNVLFGGEGLFQALLTGPGHCILQTMPFSRLVGRIMSSSSAPRGESSAGGLLGQIGDIGTIFGGS
jgi:uncharacterized protein (TIGR00266 family)